ncbi:DNA (cytosine-5-)-methyltransferase [Streptococcus dysgalactiae]|uniref:Cytosine-specific methyltransferase n=1 Tax=Streptococcus dysgalactiae subsp. dysgalactiae TaxID=99822 RepID=A0A9X7SHR1_STRDY|nr:DNA (cytosine-5-)-methyltransferase [Streptococcus dysgalactiae]QGH02316.1 DNA (cytosine-5-)-methyltransferase [Streptococcus dysgalactiae subsp. dysgalactiae]
MPFSYNKLWKLAIDKGLNKTQLRDMAGITNQSLSRLSKDQNVRLDVLDRICSALDCRIEDVMEYVENISLFDDIEESTDVPELKSSLKTISLFSGAGGLDLGLINTGFDIVFANDILKPAIENYKHNIGDIHEGDITKLNPEELPEADVVVGGFPCQPFSNAGNRLGTEDDRGNLYLEVLKMIEVKHPKVVVMENVRGLLSMKNKDGSKLIDTIVYLLENAGPGYKVKYQLLKASDYGVPQNRYRVIIVGIRSDINVDYQFPEPTTYNYDKLSVGAAIKNVDGLPNQDEVWELSPQSQNLIKFIPEGGSWKNIPYEELPDRMKRIRDDMKRYHSPNFYRRFARHEINGTITAAGTPENSGILHPVEDRRYSVREIARIQSFPDTYEFVGDSISSKYKVIGNAVPPKLGEVIGKSIVEQLAKAGY